MKTNKEHIGKFGGIGFVIAALNRLNIPALCVEHLGKPAKQARYQYSDVVLGWIYANLCGARRLEDLNTEGIYNAFAAIPAARLCSPDQLSRILRRFATDEAVHINKTSGIAHHFNRNEPFNDLLLALCKRLELLEQNKPYMLDYDGTTIPVEKYDTKPTYKGFLGYSPAVAMIDKVPVFIEARNGNTPAAYRIKEVLEGIYAQLEKHNIDTWGIRMDAASYQKEIIYYLQRLNKKFFIRVANTDDMKDDFKITAWKKMFIHGREEEIGSVEFYPFNDDNVFRFVVTRFNKSQEPGEVEYQYRGIITNEMEKDKSTGNYKMADLEVVEIYDQRGDSENNFRDLLYDFNWKRVPFSDMNSNLVFMYVSAMAKCVYQYIIEQFSQHTTDLQPTFRLKNFVARFVRPVQIEWIEHKKGWKFRLMNYRDKLDKLLNLVLS
jgi:hypothetical protein